MAPAMSKNTCVASEQQQTPMTTHFVLVPFMAQGHMIPMVDLGRLLAERGMHVTVITTPFNASRSQTTIDRAEKTGHPIRFVSLPFPCKENGLPEGCENIDVLPTSGLIYGFLDACRMLADPLKRYIQDEILLPQTSTSSSSSCVMISDMCHPWTRLVSKDLNIPMYVFYSICCFTLYSIRALARLYETENITDDKQLVIVPGDDMPHRIEVIKAQAQPFFPGPYFAAMRQEMDDAESIADGIVVNTFVELESVYIDTYRQDTGKKVWTVGPVSLCNKEAVDKAARGARSSMDESRVREWLDSMEPKSVVYVSLGSLARTPPSQLVEIGMGLQKAGRPFLWVIKAGDKMAEAEEWLSSSGFEERNGERALIIKGWAPQVMVLSHPSVGGFLTHCGWNSSLEGIVAGLPMITWPLFADQFLNERFIVDVLRIGVAVGVEEPFFWEGGGGSVGKLVEREKVTGAVERLMDGGEKAEQRRKRARDLGEKAKEAMEVGGSTCMDMATLVKHVNQHTTHA